ncbi:hypothetical protein EVA_04944 [gut metagenome]|uniref:Uncharacterized protein n=1 Tax=gut metagenome TaxID=749906 RepID=J9H0T6_9ZZZZ
MSFRYFTRQPHKNANYLIINTNLFYIFYPISRNVIFDCQRVM